MFRKYHPALIKTVCRKAHQICTNMCRQWRAAARQAFCLAGLHLTDNSFNNQLAVLLIKPVANTLPHEVSRESPLGRPNMNVELRLQLVLVAKRHFMTHAQCCDTEFEASCVASCMILRNLDQTHPSWQVDATLVHGRYNLTILKTRSCNFTRRRSCIPQPQAGSLAVAPCIQI